MYKYLILLLLGFSLFACKEENFNVPTEIKMDFEKRFSSDREVIWETEEEGYEAEFMKDGVEMSINYDLNGIWKNTETAIKLENLPLELKISIQNLYPGYSIKKVESIRSPSMKGYETLIEKDNEKVELIINENGEVLRFASDNEDDDDDDDSIMDKISKS